MSKPNEPAVSTFCCTVTCFDDEGRLDEAVMRQHFTRIADAGIGMYVGGSSPGEGYAQSMEERARLLDIAVSTAGGRVPVRAMGVEPRHAPEMKDFVRMATAAKVDAIQIYSLDVGHGNKPSNADIEAYLRDVLDVVALPAILSSHSSMNYLPPLEIIESLAADYPHLVGVNISSPDMLYLTDAVERLASRLEIHVGGPMHAASVLALGGHGFLCTESNFAPRMVQAVIDHFKAGRVHESFKSYTALMGLMRAMYAMPPGSSVRKTKAAMRYLNRPGTGRMRSPNSQLTADEIAIMGRRIAEVAARYRCEELIPQVSALD